MRNLLTILNLSMLVLLAGLPGGEFRWWLVLVGAVTAALLWRLAERERQELGDQAIDSFLADAARSHGIQADARLQHRSSTQSTRDDEY